MSTCPEAICCTFVVEGCPEMFFLYDFYCYYYYIDNNVKQNNDDKDAVVAHNEVDGSVIDNVL